MNPYSSLLDSSAPIPRWVSCRLSSLPASICEWIVLHYFQRPCRTKQKPQSPDVRTQWRNIPSGLWRWATLGCLWNGWGNTTGYKRSRSVITPETRKQQLTGNLYLILSTLFCKYATSNTTENSLQITAKLKGLHFSVLMQVGKGWRMRKLRQT